MTRETNKLFQQPVGHMKVEVEQDLVVVVVQGELAEPDDSRCSKMDSFVVVAFEENHQQRAPSIDVKLFLQEWGP